VLEWLFDGWWSSPWDFTDTLTQALYLRLLLDERFDFHGSATPAFTKVSAWSSLSMAVSRRSLSEVGLWALQRVYLEYSFHGGCPIGGGTLRRIDFGERSREVHGYSLSTTGAC